MSRPAIETMIQEEIAPFFSRLTLSNLRSQQVFHALLGFQRLCEPSWTPHERLKLARKPYFDDALLLFEILVQATGEGQRGARRLAGRGPPPAAPQGARRERGARASRAARRRRRPRLVTSFTKPGRLA